MALTAQVAVVTDDSECARMRRQCVLIFFERQFYLYIITCYVQPSYCYDYGMMIGALQRLSVLATPLSVATSYMIGSVHRARPA